MKPTREMHQFAQSLYTSSKNCSEEVQIITSVARKFLYSKTAETFSEDDLRLYLQALNNLLVGLPGFDRGGHRVPVMQFHAHSTPE